MSTRARAHHPNSLNGNVLFFRVEILELSFIDPNRDDVQLRLHFLVVQILNRHLFFASGAKVNLATFQLFLKLCRSSSQTTRDVIAGRSLGSLHRSLIII